MSTKRDVPTLNGLTTSQSTRTSTKCTSSVRTILLWVLLVLIIGFPSVQIHLSLTIPDDTTLGVGKENIHHMDHPPRSNKVNLVANSYEIRVNQSSVSATTKTPFFYPNITYEIFDAPSNIYKYTSPVVPATERQWLETKRRQWPPKHIPTNLPLPIFVLNLPKSGTQSIYDYFAKCGGMGKHWVAHYWIQRFHSKVGQCFADNVWNDRPMAQGCGEAKLAGYAIYTDAGLMWSEENEDTIKGGIDPKNKSSSTRKKCFFPGIHGLDNIAKYYPNATILHFPRNASQWVESSSHWNHILIRYDLFCGGFSEILVGDNVDDNSTTSPVGEYNPKYPATTETEWAIWYNAYTQRIRDFVKHHSSLTYVESPLEEINQTANLLQVLTGIPASCYGRTHVNKKQRTKQE
jgi:hypothetical protein